MKYIDAEKLIAEIERRIKENEVFPHRYIRLNEDKQLLSFITSLQQEQLEVDLEKEVESYLDGFIKTPTRTYFRDAIRHFYERGLNKIKEEQI